jgi:transketolase
VRNAFIRALTEVAEKDARVVFLTGDLGFKLFDDFARRFPGRFHNVGVAEATMAGVASGLALEGKKPFIYSIVPFATLRCYEQIRNDICYHDADVAVVGVGGGYSYGQNGPTHHALEDVAALRVLPNMSVVCPGDPHETVAAVRAIAARRGPVYLRLGRAGEKVVHAGPVELPWGKALVLREGTDLAIASTGNMLATAVATAERLLEKGFRARVLSFPFVKPLDTDAIDRAAHDLPLLATLEEHARAGGFGSAVAEHLSEKPGRARLRRFGAKDEFAHECGDQEFHRKRNGLTPEAIAAELAGLL